jgi:hypothetical protein
VPGRSPMSSPRGRSAARSAARSYDPTDTVGRLLFNVLAMAAVFESHLIRLRTGEGMKVARPRGRLLGKQPKLNRKQEAPWSPWCTLGSTAPSRSPSPPAVGRSTVYRAIERQRVAAKAEAAGAPSTR